MQIETRHIFFFVFTAITLLFICGIADGVVSGPDSGVTYTLMHGDLSARAGAFLDLWNANYDWLSEWAAWPLRIINWVFAVLIVRFLWSLVPVIGR